VPAVKQSQPSKPARPTDQKATAQQSEARFVELPDQFADFDQALRRDTESGSNAIPKHSRGHTGAWLAGIAVFLGCCLLVACGVIAFLLYGQHRAAEQPTATGKGSVNPVASPSDPKAQFVAFMPGEIQRLKKAVPELSINAPSYDVRKTDSLVSPYLATCTMDVIWQKATGTWADAMDEPDPTDAKELKNQVMIPFDWTADIRGSLTSNYAYQDGHWTFKGGTCHLPVQEHDAGGGHKYTINPAYDCTFDTFSELKADTLYMKRFKEIMDRKKKALERITRRLKE